jgi:hypothetical protein
MVHLGNTFVLSLAPSSINQKIFIRTNQQWQTFAHAFGISFQLEGLFIWPNKILLIFLWSNQIGITKKMSNITKKMLNILLGMSTMIDVPSPHKNPINTPILLIDTICNH